MNIKVTLFLVTSFFSTSLSVNKRETPLKTSYVREVKSISKDCPTLLKIIEDNNITSYSTSCRYSEANLKKITEESVLGQACLLVQNMLLYICENKINITNNILSIDGNKKIPICPFNFTFFPKSNISYLSSIKKILTNEKHCNQVCYDFDEPKKQCIVLDKINTFLKNSNLCNYNSDKRPEVLPEATEIEANPITDSLKTDLEGESEKITEGDLLSKKNIIKEETVYKSKEENTVTAQITPIIKSEVNLEDQNVTNEKKLSEDVYIRKEELIYNLSTSGEPNFTLLDKSVTPKNVPETSNPHNNESNLKNGNVINDAIEGEEDHEELIDADLQKQDGVDNENKFSAPKETSLQESSVQNEIYSGEVFFQAEDSHFFFFFLMCSSVIIIGYLAFHNKKKILAFALEGRNGRRIRRRPNPARYRKLESNLEEVIASNDSHTSASNVVY